MAKLPNKTALITGGTSGIGLATAKDFIREGAKVIITGRFSETVDQTVQALGPAASGIVSDAGKMQDLLKLREQVEKFTPAIDVLFVNAAYARFAPMEMVSEEDMDELFNVIVKGSFFTVQQLLPLIGEGGSVILNSSVVADYGAAGTSVYSAAKSAVRSFVKTFAAEFLSRKIRINGISPGYTSTNGFEKTGLTRDQIEEVIGAVIPTLPLKRFAHADEVAKGVSFLASDDASYIHGTELIVDGGYITVK